MKTIIISVVLFFTSLNFVYNQALKEVYTKDIVQLQPVNDFAQATDWQVLFPDYAKKTHGKNLGQMKKIIVAPDGSIFMSHKTNKYEIWKFDSKGMFIKKIGSKGSRPGQFIYEPGIEGILDGKYIITSEVNGRINFFDLNGNFVKMLTLDYGPLSIIPLKNNKIAILGGVPWKNNQWKEILRIKDFNTGDEKEIWQKISDPDDARTIKVKYPEGGMMGCSLPYTHPILTRFRMAADRNGNLVIASPVTGEVKVFSPEGQVLNSFNLNISAIRITDDDIQEQYNKAVGDAADFEKNVMANSRWTDTQKKELIESYKSQLIKFKDRNIYPESLPYFSSMVIDSDGNLIVFEFTKDEVNTSNRFSAYSYEMTGQLIGKSSFKSDDFKLTFTPAAFQFSHGYVYTVAIDNKELNGPPQLLKMKIL